MEEKVGIPLNEIGGERGEGDAEDIGESEEVFGGEGGVPVEMLGFGGVESPWREEDFWGERFSGDAERFAVESDGVEAHPGVEEEGGEFAFLSERMRFTTACHRSAFSRRCLVLGFGKRAEIWSWESLASRSLAA